jgi:putative transposase
VGRSWFVDETYLKVQGCWVDLYRAIVRSGALVDVI